MARGRVGLDSLHGASSYSDELEENSNNENIANDDLDLAERSPMMKLKIKKALRSGYFLGNDARLKKYFGESSNFRNGHSIQGLWAMPGRR